MHFHPLHVTLPVLLSTLTLGLPLENALNHLQIEPRAATKSYAIVNVDGGSSSTGAPPQASPAQPTTITDNKTKTEVVEAPTTATNTVTATAAPPVPPPTSSSSISPTSSSSASKAPETQTVTQTPAPSVVTVIITETSSPTAFYDDGMWHTSYAIKTWPSVSTMMN